MELGKAIITICVIASFASLWRFLEVFWWRPKKMAAKIYRQGIRGPPPKFLVGNATEILSMRRAKNKEPFHTITHDIVGHALPEFVHYSQKYGKRYVHWWGTEPRVMILEPELIRDVLAKRLQVFPKSASVIRGFSSLIGRGLVIITGEEWSVHRRVVAPAFYMEKLKAMVPTMSDCADRMVNNWEMRLEKEPELEISSDLRKVTADIISHTAFGSSYAEGQRVFDIMQQFPLQQRLFSWIPFFRYIPLPVNLKIRSLQNEVNSILIGLVRDRRNIVKSLGEKSDAYGNDLLGLLLAESESEKGSILNDQSIIDECKTFYFAGHESTATLLSWTVMLLAAYPEWQERLRVEVHKDDASEGDVFNKYKQMKMVFNEALRLYPPVMMMIRNCSEDTKLGDLHLPKGCAVAFPIIAIHRSTEYWGPDANEFNPERFIDGISGACKHPNAFLPFSLGPRVCVGQLFSLLEARVVLAAILRRFAFKLSPNYHHNPIATVTMKPYDGLPIILNKLVD